MPHIEFEKAFRAFSARCGFSPQTAEPMNALANALMCSDEGLSRGELRVDSHLRFIAKRCFFCQTIHGAYCQCLPGR